MVVAIGPKSVAAGVGDPAIPADKFERSSLLRQRLKANDFAGVAAVYRAYPSSIEASLGNLYGGQLAPLLLALEGRSDLRLELASLTLDDRHYGDLGILREVRTALTTSEQQALLKRVKPRTRAGLLAAGFAPLTSIAPPRPEITAQDLVRLSTKVKAHSVALTELLEDLGFAARIEAVRQQQPAFEADARSIVAAAVRGLAPRDLQVLQGLLVDAAGGSTKGHPLFTKKPSVEAVMTILSGELFGVHPLASAELRKEAEKGVRESRLAPGETAAQWVALTSQSDTAVEFTKEVFSAFELLRAFTLAELDAVDLGLGRPSWEQSSRAKSLHEAVSYDADRVRAAKAFFDKHGPRRFEAALDCFGLLDDAPWELHRELDPLGFDTRRAVDALGFEGAADLAQAIKNNPRGARCALALVPQTDDALYRLAKGRSQLQLDKLFARSGAQVADFSSDGRALTTWSRWPSARVQKHDLDPASASAQIQLMKAELAQISPSKAAQLERELLGRQFISHHTYQALYDKGVEHPEHAYFLETFSGWSIAKSALDAAAVATRGRPLKAGELQSLLRSTHALAAAAMVTKEALPSGAVGKLRSEIAPADLPLLFGGTAFQWSEAKVYTGGGAIDAADLERLRRNPLLTVHLDSDERGQEALPEGKVRLLGIELSAVKDVSPLIDQLDDWVRANEGKIPPHALAAEVHHRIVSIHPFLDGNGRVGKLIANFLLARAGVEPAIWRYNNVLLHHDTWPEVVRDGVNFNLEIVERHWRAATA